jgi:hypothetical protein
MAGSPGRSGIPQLHDTPTRHHWLTGHLKGMMNLELTDEETLKQKQRQGHHAVDTL